MSASWASELSVLPHELEWQLRTLAARGYRGVTFSEAVLAPQSRKTVAITFDDAYRSVHELASPILSQLGFPGTVFVPSAYAGTEEPMDWPGIDHWLGSPHERELVPMSWAELRDLADLGWEIGSHTRTHPRLTTLADGEVSVELTGSRSECEERLGLPCRSVAYPYGDHDERIVEAAREAGYAAAGTLPARLHASEPLRWPRIGIYHRDRRARFRLKVWAPLRSLRATQAGRLVERR